MTPTDQPTPAELRALRAYVATGRVKLAARSLNLSEHTVSGQIKAACSKVGAKSIAQAVFILHDQLAA